MAINPEVPALYPCALDGRAFLIDNREGDGFVTASIPQNRNQADQGARPGEQTLTPEELWRRTVESWHHGAGQRRADREASDPYRFRTSLHLNPWERFELSLLNTVNPASNVSPGSTVLADMVSAEGYVYYVTDDDVLYITAIDSAGNATTSAATGIAAAGSTSAASDGHYVYVTQGVADIFRGDGATGVFASYVTNASANLRLVRYAKGRLLVFDNAGKFYNPVVAGALPAATFTHPMGASFFWTDATEGTANIYMCGNGGSGVESHGVVYRCAVKADGTALDVPIIAARLPDGELVYAIQGYLGLVFLGTSKGVRTCVEASDGSLVVGALIESGPCRCFEPQGTQVWFGWDSFSEITGDEWFGLGRIDLADYDGTGAPAYATDIMSDDVSGGAQRVGAVASFGDRRVFAGEGTGSGLYCETQTPHDSGYLVSGLFAFGLSEPKAFHYLTVRCEDVWAYVSPVDATTGDQPETVWAPGRTNLGNADRFVPTSVTTPGKNPAIFDLGGHRALGYEYMLRVFDTVEGVTLQAKPALPSRAERGVMRLLVTERDDVSGLDRPRTPADEVAHIRQLVRLGTPVDLQDGSETYQVTVEDYEYTRERGSDEKLGSWNGAIRVAWKRYDTLTPIFRAASSATGDSDTVTLDVPDGTMVGDVLYAAVAWEGSALGGPAAPTVGAGWTMIGSASTAFVKSATFKRTEPDTFGPLTLTWAASTQYAVGMVAYTQGDEVLAVTSQSGTRAGNVDSMAFDETFADSPVAALVATAAGSTGGVAPPTLARPRVSVVNPDALSGRPLTLEIGDATSTSTWVDESVGSGTVDRVVGHVGFGGNSGDTTTAWLAVLT